MPFSHTPDDRLGNTLDEIRSALSRAKDGVSDAIGDLLAEREAHDNTRLRLVERAKAAELAVGAWTTRADAAEREAEQLAARIDQMTQQLADALEVVRSDESFDSMLRLVRDHVAQLDQLDPFR